MPHFSIIIPVLNEGGVINDAIEHVRGIEGGDKCQIIIVDGDERRGTTGAIQHDGVICLARCLCAGAAL